ncbi:ankyrin-like protein [Colletotrichum asianum]|uniref:Ankyrin-like protein n=1 Tax=Colletotrichum asianum TaxID=702518 RepID=A0A8H3WAC7_9PEZI|nr:ankyrin-like protein [Colletotrichum asianum]
MSPHARWGAPLHFAIIYGHQDVVEWLISSGVDIEAPARLYCGCDNLDNIFQCYEPFRTHFDNDVMVWTPLHYAICHKQTEIAHRLLTAGSSPLCSIPARPELWPPGLEILEELYSDRATEIRHRRVYNNLYDNTCSLYGGRNDSITALDTAVVVGDKSIVTRLIKDMEMDPNWRKSALNSKIFQYSAVSGDESMIDHLLSLGCGSKLLLTAESDSGHTSFPIYIAFRMHHPSAASKLVVCGTSIWSKEAVWNYETKESIEKPIPLLSKVLAGWGKWTPRLLCCGLVDKVCNHHEHDRVAQALKRRLRIWENNFESMIQNIQVSSMSSLHNI